MQPNSRKGNMACESSNLFHAEYFYIQELKIEVSIEMA